jgi:ribosome-associated protein
VSKSTSLSHQQKGLLKKSLGSRISHDGILRIVSSKERTQLANRRAAVNRFISLMAEALEPPKLRKKTNPPLAADRRRIETKSRRAEVKRTRTSVPLNGD